MGSLAPLKPASGLCFAKQSKTQDKENLEREQP